MSNHSRRAIILAGIATAPALAAPTLAHPTGDARLRELWPQYLQSQAAELAAQTTVEKARAAYETEKPPCPPDVWIVDHDKAHRPLWEKHGLDRLYDAWNKAGERTDAIVRTILAEEAEGLFGVGAKLAALPTQDDQDSSYDQETAIRSALRNIDRLIGTTFFAAFAKVSTTGAEDDDFEPDEGSDNEDEVDKAHDEIPEGVS